MEDLVAAMKSMAAAMRDMAASMNAVKTTVDESQTILRESGTWKPQVDGALQEMCSDITTNATSSPDGAVPAKCSTLGLSPNVGGVEAVESSQQSGMVSTVSPGPVGAPPPSTMQQFGILKPDKHTPTNCSTVVLDMGSDAMRAKRDTRTMQANLVYTPTAAAVFPATTPPHPPDQPRLLLDRPPPWPPWKVSFMLCMERHGCCNACNDQLNWMFADHLCGLDEVARLDGIGGTLISSVQTLHNVCLTVSVLPKLTTIGSKGNSCFHLGNTIGVSLADEETFPWNKCEATWFICWCCSQQNTSSWQQSQWHVHMMGSFTPNLSTFTQTFAAHGIECAEFKPQSMLHMIVQAAHPNAENKLLDLRAAWGTCEYLLARPSHDFVAFCGNSSGDLVMLSITVPWDPGVGHELSIEKFKSGFTRQQSGELLISTSSCDYFACCMCAWAVNCDRLGKHHGAQHPYIAYPSHARMECRISHYLSYWVMNVWTLANQFSEIQCTCQIVPQKFLTGSASTAEPLLLFDGSAVISPCQIHFILVHIQHFLMENWIHAPSAMWCFCLLPGAVEELTKLQKVQAIGIQRALLLHLLIPLQQKPGGWVFLRNLLSPTEYSLHCTGDLGWYMVSSPLTTPWDPGLQLRQTAPDTSPFQPGLGDLPTSFATWEEEPQLHAHFPRAPAWGQAGIEEGGNVTTLPITSSLGACEVSGDGAATPPTPSKAPGWTGTVGPLNTSNTEGNGVDEQNTETYLSLFSEPYPCFSL